MIEGRIDEFKNGTIYGWAAETTDYSSKVEIAVFRGASLLVQAAADRVRQDLAAGGIGDGAHAFEIQFEGSDLSGVRVVARSGEHEKVLEQSSAEERKLEALFDLHLARLEDALRRLRRDQQQIAAAMASNNPTAVTGELRSDLDALAKRVAAAEARMESYEIFVMRIDSQIRTLTETAPKKSWLGRTRQ